MILSSIAAVSENNVIGRDQALPWNIPEDLKRFKKITLGHPVIMGRKTFESMGRPLPRRPNIVVSRNAELKIDGVQVVASVEEGIAPYRKTDEEVFIIGGGQIYFLTQNWVDRIYLTRVHQEVEGDAFFPKIDLAAFEITFEEKHLTPVPYTFIDYIRKPLLP